MPRASLFERTIHLTQDERTDRLRTTAVDLGSKMVRSHTERWLGGSLRLGGIWDAKICTRISYQILMAGITPLSQWGAVLVALTYLRICQLNPQVLGSCLSE